MTVKLTKKEDELLSEILVKRDALNKELMELNSKELIILDLIIEANHINEPIEQVRKEGNTLVFSFIAKKGNAKAKK